MELLDFVIGISKIFIIFMFYIL